MKKLTIFSIFLTHLFANEIDKEITTQAVLFFLFFIMVTILVIYFAAKKTKTAKDFYTAGGGITGLQNGLAISGDYMSAASFLGISGLVYLNGFDGLIYSVGFLVGWPVILFLIAEQLRNLGRYTFADVASYRLKQTPIRILAAFGSIATVVLYLIAQMVGSGKLIEILFGIPYTFSVIIVGVIMVFYVAFGGMLASTWVQIIKAFLLLFGATFMAIVIMQKVDFSFETLFTLAANVKGDHQILSSGLLVNDPISILSLGLALMLGTAGLPHILMRFFTVANAKEARKSVFYATSLIGYFYILTFIIGFGAIVLVGKNPTYFNLVLGELIGGNNMAAIYLSHAIGGDLFLGFIAAVTFTTILAVVSGLTLAGASAISHDLFARVIAKDRVTRLKEVQVLRYAAIVIGLISILLGIVFEHQNIAFIVGLAFAIAASANFPILFLSIYWEGLTTKGAVVGGVVGLAAVLILIVLGPVVWGEVIHNDRSRAIFPYEYPAIFTVPLAFFTTWLFSKLDKSKRAKLEKEAFRGQFVRSQTGIGAKGVVYF